VTRERGGYKGCLFGLQTAIKVESRGSQRVDDSGVAFNPGEFSNCTGIYITGTTEKNAGVILCLKLNKITCSLAENGGA
jgi:hypothetical protein